MSGGRHAATALGGPAEHRGGDGRRRGWGDTLSLLGLAPDGRTAVVANGLTTGRAGELLRPGQEELLVVTLADGKVVGRGVEVDGNAAYVLVFGKGVDRMDLDTGASTPVLDLTCALGRREYEVESMILATDARKLLLGTSTGGVLVVPL